MEIRKYLLCCFIVFSSCNGNVGYKNPQQISKTIEEAKNKNVFVATYKISNIQKLNSNMQFPFDTIWREKSWHLELDNRGKEFPKVDDSAYHQIVFGLNNKDPFVTVDNFIEGKWITWDNYEHPVGSINGMFVIMVPQSFIEDTLRLTIFKKALPVDSKNNLTPLFKFDIVKE